MPAALPARLPDLLADDRALLARFADRADDAAFATVVRRHGPMVLGVCRRAVHDAHAAEDAFQATFLVLARNPAAALGAGSVGGWLHGIARRVGMAAKRRDRRRGRREAAAARAAVTPAPPGWDDLLEVLDAELARLPADDRAALVACYLREQTQDEAARELGWSLSTLRRRLAAAKDRLRARLSRRGLTPDTAFLAAGLGACVAVPPALARATVERCLPGSSVPPAVAALAGGTKVGAKLAGAAVAVVLGWVALGTAAPPPAPAARVVAVATPIPAREWVTVRGSVVFPKECTIPPARAIDPAKWQPPLPACCTADGRTVYDETVLIDPTTRGIANVVVWLRPDTTDRKDGFPAERVHPALRAPKAREHVMRAAACQFRPRVVVARTGDALTVRNDLDGSVNVRYEPGGGGVQPGAPFNRLLLAGGPPTPPVELRQAGRGPGRLVSDIYPWMAGSVWAFDHPYAAVTDAGGGFALRDVPVGRWRLVLWHEAGGYPAGDRPGPVGRRVEVTDRGGVTDLGALRFESHDWAPAE